MGIVWMVWPLAVDGVTEDNSDHSTVSLSRQRPGSAQKLERWMKRWSQESGKDIPESFR